MASQRSPNPVSGRLRTNNKDAILKPSYFEEVVDALVQHWDHMHPVASQMQIRHRGGLPLPRQLRSDLVRITSETRVVDQRKIVLSCLNEHTACMSRAIQKGQEEQMPLAQAVRTAPSWAQRLEAKRGIVPQLVHQLPVQPTREDGRSGHKDILTERFAASFTRDCMTPFNEAVMSKLYDLSVHQAPKLLEYVNSVCQHKLRQLTAADDRESDVPAELRLSPAEWRIVNERTLRKKHFSYPVTETNLPGALLLVRLARELRIHRRPLRWLELQRRYEASGRTCSAIVLQRRFHHILETTHRALRDLKEPIHMEMAKIFPCFVLRKPRSWRVYSRTSLQRFQFQDDDDSDSEDVDAPTRHNRGTTQSPEPGCSTSQTGTSNGSSRLRIDVVGPCVDSSSDDSTDSNLSICFEGKHNAVHSKQESTEHPSRTNIHVTGAYVDSDVLTLAAGDADAVLESTEHPSRTNIHVTGAYVDSDVLTLAAGDADAVLESTEHPSRTNIHVTGAYVDSDVLTLAAGDADAVLESTEHPSRTNIHVTGAYVDSDVLTLAAGDADAVLESPGTDTTAPSDSVVINVDNGTAMETDSDCYSDPIILTFGESQTQEGAIDIDAEENADAVIESQTQEGAIDIDAEENADAVIDTDEVDGDLRFWCEDEPELYPAEPENNTSTVGAVEMLGSLNLRNLITEIVIERDLDISQQLEDTEESAVVD